MHKLKYDFTAEDDAARRKPSSEAFFIATMLGLLGLGVFLILGVVGDIMDPEPDTAHVSALAAGDIRPQPWGADRPNAEIVR